MFLLFSLISLSFFSYSFHPSSKCSFFLLACLSFHCISWLSFFFLVLFVCLSFFLFTLLLTISYFTYLLIPFFIYSIRPLLLSPMKGNLYINIWYFFNKRKKLARTTKLNPGLTKKYIDNFTIFLYVNLLILGCFRRYRVGYFRFVGFPEFT